MKITAQILAGSIATLLLATHSTQAANAAWNVSANGDWVTDSNWTPAAAPGAVSGTTSTDIATFSNTLTLLGKTITVDANRNIGGISFGNTSAFGFTLTGGNLLLSNAGVIQTLAANGAHMDTVASAIAIQDDGGSASFTALSTNNNSLLNIAGAVTGVSTAGNTTTLNLNGTNLGGNVITGIIGDGSLGGKLALTKSAAGTWQLNGANTYTGTTTLTLGTLVVDHASALGVGGNITFGGGTLQYTATSAGQDWSTRFKNTTAGGILLNTNGSDVTLAGVIDSSNTAGLTKSGGATLTLSGANTYTGVTTIGGTVMSVLRLNDASALGGGGNLTFTGGRLQYTANNTVDYSARIVGSTGAITIDTNGQNVAFGSALAASNTAGIYKMGTGDLTFGGNISHLYTGNTSLNGGRLILDNTGAGNNNSNRITDGSNLTVNNGTFLYKGSDQAATNSTETLGGFNVGVGALTVAFGGTNTATFTAANLNQSNRGSFLVNGTNLGMDTASTASVGRLKITSAPTLFGTTNALDTGINVGAQDTKIVSFLVGESTATSGGTGTATGIANTFVTWNANTGLRPLNPTDEFVQNAVTATKNTRITSATTASTSAAINSLVMNGGDLTISSGQNLTNTSGAILFASSGTIKTIGGASGFLFTGENQEYLVSVNSGVTATISSAFTGTANGNQIALSGGGTLNLRGNSTLNSDTNIGKSSRLVAEGGGTLNVTGVIMAFATTASNRGNGTNLVGQTSSGNTLNIAETGRLRAGGLAVGADVFGNNTVTISSPGNSAAPTYHLNGNGAQLNMGVSSSNNSMVISNGAYVRQDQGGGSNGWNIGTNAGANNNSILVTGIGSTVNRSGAAGSFINLGVSGNGNSLTVNAGAALLPRRMGIGLTGGSNNFLLVTGYRSLFSSSADLQSRLQIANSVGAQGNYMSVEAGATADFATAGPFAVGSLSGADNNYVRVTGTNSVFSVPSTTPFTFGGAETTVNTPIDSNAKGNHLDVFSGATLVANSIGLMGVNSSFNLGNGTGTSLATVGLSGAFTPGVLLRNLDSQLNFNNGRLIAGAGGSLVSGLGTVVLNGPAFISTTQTNSAISAVIANGTSNSLTKEGTGTLIFSNANTYTGTTKVNAGTLALDYTVVGSKLADTSTLTLGGGTLNLRNGASAHVEVVASTSLNAGLSQVTQTVGSTSTLRTNLITPGVGVVNFGSDSIADTDNLNDASDAGGILGAWATVGGLDWAVNSTAAADGAITAYTGYTSYDAYGSVLADNPTNNARLDTAAGSGDITLGATTTTVNTLLQSNTLGAAVVQTAGGVLATNGIMIASNGDALTIGGAAGDGALQSATASGTLVLNNSNSLTLLTINAPITDNGGASALATVGAVTLAGVNTYTGATGVGGTLTLDGAAQLGGGSYAGAISIAAGGKLVVNSSANQILSGVISGDGGFTQSGLGTTTLSGANTYTGLTTISEGILQAGNSTAFGPATTASLSLSINGRIQLNGNNITVTALNGTSASTVVESGSATSGTDTLTLEAGRNTAGAVVNSSYLGILQDGSTRALALIKNGPGGLTLSGNSTYTGGTTVNAGSLTLASQTGLGTGTLTLAEGSLFQQAGFDGNAVEGAIPNVINLSGGQVFINLPSTQKDLWLSQDVSGSGAMRLLSDATGRTLTLSGAKTFTGGILQTSGSLISTGTGNGQFPNVAIDDIASLGAGTFKAQINSTDTTKGVLRTLADLSAGVANAFEIAASSRLLIEANTTNHLKLSGVISGNGDLIKTGSATLTLSGTNTYTGATSLVAGIVSVSAEANLGGANALVFNGGTFQVTGTTMQNFGIHAPTFTATKTIGIDVANAAHTFTVSQVLNQTTGQLTKTGDGTLALTNTNTYIGRTNANGGVLLLSSAGAVSATSQIVFNGGVIGLGNGDFNRGLDFIGLANSANFTGAGGWAAYTADRTVNLGGAGSPIVWQDADTGFNSQTLILGGSTADKTVTLVNPLDLGIGDRTLRVDNGTAANDAILSGDLSSTVASLTKTGTGTVQLNGLQAYDALNASAGTTNVNGLLGTAPGAAAVTVAAGASLKFGSVSQELASLTIGAGSTVTFTGGSASGAFTSSGGGSKAPSFGSAVVPEPGTIGLLLVGALGMLNRRRRQA
jgi:autotransporter-associated beta strand protein